MWILQIFLLVSGLDCNEKQSFKIQNTTYPFSLNDLPYSLDFLNEFIPSRIVMIHHDTHQKSYMTKLNSYVSTTPIFQNTFLSELCVKGWGNGNLQKYAGGLYNHYLYWWVITKASCSSPLPTGALLSKITESWGDFPTFIATFESKANNVFGNGWTWLCYNTTGKLEIQNTLYQLNPLMESSGNLCYPILGIDLWEHAFYLKYTYDRASYVKDFIEMIDWPVVEYFYKAFAKNFYAVPF